MIEPSHALPSSYQGGSLRLWSEGLPQCLIMFPKLSRSELMDVRRFLNGNCPLGPVYPGSYRDHGNPFRGIIWFTVLAGALIAP